MARNEQPFSFQDELIPSEQILWEGRSAISFFHYVRLRAGCTVVAYWIIVLGALGWFSAGNKAEMMGALIFGFLMIPITIVFAINGLFTLYREFKKYGLAQYAVTNNRLIVRDRTGIVSAPIKSIPAIVKTDDPKGLGTLQFQVPNFPKFFRIKDADSVYKLITELQSKIT